MKHRVHKLGVPLRVPSSASGHPWRTHRLCTRKGECVACTTYGRTIWLPGHPRVRHTRAAAARRSSAYAPSASRPASRSASGHSGRRSSIRPPPSAPACDGDTGPPVAPAGAGTTPRPARALPSLLRLFSRHAPHIDVYKPTARNFSNSRRGQCARHALQYRITSPVAVTCTSVLR